ncbi:hypothetical protein KBD45_04095 [Candidatus Dojkabacteria bacterium]|nr:hypothetical protein [Candidatus Dojkabacteria bacterium]
MEANQVKSDICCPKFNPALWDGKTVEWNDKKFIKDKVFTLLYMPLNFGSVMKKVDTKVTQADAKIPDALFLSDHTSMWNMDLYVAVDKNIPNAENVVLSGKYFSKVYDGNFQDTGKWMKDFEIYTKENDIHVKKTYMWYTTCPKCAKKYGHNYVVILGELL